MIFFYGLDGVPINVSPSVVNQNSNNASTIYFISPKNNENLSVFVNVAFTLPNGVNLPQRVMRPLTLETSDGLNGVMDINGNKFYVWFYRLKSDVTAYAGQVTCQFFVTTQDGTVTTTAQTFTVNPGVPAIEPEETDSYEELLELVSTALASKQDVLTPGENITIVNNVISAVVPDVVQETGNSQTAVMSQDATTEAINSAKSDVQNSVDQVALNLKTYGKSLEINNSTYELFLKDADDNILSTIDLPLETMVVDAEYNEETKEIVLTLRNGNTVSFSVADLVSGFKVIEANPQGEATETLDKITIGAITYRIGGSGGSGGGGGVSVIVGTVAPTTSTVGELGSFYFDTTNNNTYQCVAVDTETPSYTWVKMIRETDYATSQKRGVVKIDSPYGVGYVNGNNAPIGIVGATNQNIDARTNIYKPITSSTLNYAVKVGVTDNGIELTETEQAQARAWIGAKLYNHHIALLDTNNFSNKVYCTIPSRSAEKFTIITLAQYIASIQFAIASAQSGKAASGNITVDGEVKNITHLYSTNGILYACYGANGTARVEVNGYLLDSAVEEIL